MINKLSLKYRIKYSLVESNALIIKDNLNENDV